MRPHGFTLLELLMIIGILGILLGLGTPSYQAWLASLEVQEAATTLAQEIQRVRTEIKKAPLPTTGAQPEASVVMTAGRDSFTAGGRHVMLDRATIDTRLTATFEAPYGTLVLAAGASLPQSVTLRSTRMSSKTRTVRIVSLLGKVVVQ